MYLLNTSIYDPLLVFLTDTYCMYVCKQCILVFLCVFLLYPIPYSPKRAGIFIRCNTDMVKVYWVDGNKFMYVCL